MRWKTGFRRIFQSLKRTLKTIVSWIWAFFYLLGRAIRAFFYAFLSILQPSTWSQWVQCIISERTALAVVGFLQFLILLFSIYTWTNLLIASDAASQFIHAVLMAVFVALHVAILREPTGSWMQGALVLFETALGSALKNEIATDSEKPHINLILWYLVQISLVTLLGILLRQFFQCAH